jgi:isopentenyldiphosphate isomerase
MNDSPDFSALVDVTDSEGFLTGTTLPLATVHDRGLWHRVVHVWLYTDTHLLFQRRKDASEVLPRSLDASVSGYVLAGEQPREAAVRALEHELGFRASPPAARLLYSQSFTVPVHGLKHPRRVVTLIYAFHVPNETVFSLSPEGSPETQWLSLVDVASGVLFGESAVSDEEVEYYKTIVEHLTRTLS